MSTTLQLEIGQTYSSQGAGVYEITGKALNRSDIYLGKSVTKHGDYPSNLVTSFRTDGKCTLFDEPCDFDLKELVSD